MITNRAVTVTIRNTLYVVEKIPTVGYQVLTFKGLEIEDIWETESFDGLSDLMTAIVDLPVKELNEIEWYDVFASIE